jgi:hypothetical protein
MDIFRNGLWLRTAAARAGLRFVNHANNKMLRFQGKTVTTRV